jgi:probable HAF family extracellular repeat protein
MMRERRPSFKPCLEALEDRLCPSTYAVIDLGTLGGTASLARDINNASQVQVVGDAYTAGNAAGHGFLWQNAKMTDLGTLGGTNSDARSINNSTQVVGQADTGAVDASGNPIGHAFLWQNGVMTDLGTLGGTGGSGAYDINTSGQVVGAAATASNASDAFVWQNGVMTDLNSLLPANSGWILSSATGINDNGQITGEGTINGQGRAYLFSGGAITNLGNLGGPGSSIAHGLNNSGQVVGLGSVSNIQSFAFLYTAGVMTNLGSLNGGSSADSEAFDINKATQVVGLSTYGTHGLLDPHAALWQNGQITDLNKVIAKNSGWVLGKAFGINDTGCIAGWGSINNQHHAFLAIPPSMALTSATTAVAGPISGSVPTVASVTPPRLSAESALAVILAGGHESGSLLSPYLVGVLASAQPHAAQEPALPPSVGNRPSEMPLPEKQPSSAVPMGSLGLLFGDELNWPFIAKEESLQSPW